MTQSYGYLSNVKKITLQLHLTCNDKKVREFIFQKEDIYYTTLVTFPPGMGYKLSGVYLIFFMMEKFKIIKVFLKSADLYPRGQHRYIPPPPPLKKRKKV